MASPTPSARRSSPSTAAASAPRTPPGPTVARSTRSGASSSSPRPDGVRLAHLHPATGGSPSGSSLDVKAVRGRRHLIDESLDERVEHRLLQMSKWPHDERARNRRDL